MPRGREVWWHLINSEAFTSRRKRLKSDIGETAAVGPVRAKAGATGVGLLSQGLLLSLKDWLWPSVSEGHVYGIRL